MLPTVPYSPNMSYDQLIRALNENLAMQQNAAQTQIINDTTGTPRIIIGKLPDNTFGIIISKPGVNVVSLFTS